MGKHVWIAAMVMVATVSVGYPQQTADTILHNGKIVTVDVARKLSVRKKELHRAFLDELKKMKEDGESWERASFSYGHFKQLNPIK